MFLVLQLEKEFVEYFVRQVYNWVFEVFYYALYFYFFPYQREILHFILHYIYLTAGVWIEINIKQYDG